MPATILRVYDLDTDNPQFAFQIPGTHNSPTMTSMTTLAEARALAASDNWDVVTRLCRGIAAAHDYRALVGVTFD